MPLVNLNLITVQGTYVTQPDGLPMVGSVMFVPSAVVRDPTGNQIIMPKVVIAPLDAGGSFSVQLAATNDPDITPTFTYSVTEQVTGGESYSIEVPINTPGGILNLADVPRTSPEVLEGGETFVQTVVLNDLENRMFTAEPVYTAPSAASVTVAEPAISSITRVVLTQATTLVFPSLLAGKSFVVALTQDATGGRTVTWPATVRWDGNFPPMLTTTANKTDVLSFLSLDGLTWVGMISAQAV